MHQTWQTRSVLDTQIVPLNKISEVLNRCRHGRPPNRAKMLHPTVKDDVGFICWFYLAFGLQPSSEYNLQYKEKHKVKLGTVIDWKIKTNKFIWENKRI